jgi:DNA processing protein
MWALSRHLLTDLGVRPGRPRRRSRHLRFATPSTGEGSPTGTSKVAADEPWLSHVEVELVGALPSSPRVAIVGARAATARAIRKVSRLVEAARRAGYAVFSGGARGIDGDVHRAALEVDVPQAVILPLHLTTPYPPEHEPLFRDIVDRGGAIVCPPCARAIPGRWAFVARNEWLVALVDRVIVVEAAQRSGSTHTGRLARTHGRLVAAFAGSPGGDALIAGGAVCLGHLGEDESAGLVERTVTFLCGRGHDATRPAWPRHLAALEACVGASPSFTLDDVGVHHFTAVLEAESRGLIVRIDPIRWARVGWGGQGAGETGSSPSPPAVSSKGPKP